MKKNYDEPTFINKATVINSPDEQNVRNKIKEMLDSESFAVLSTQGEGQPYSSLISFAFSEDLRTIIFATPSKTRKFDLISKSDRVSILIDNRSTNPESINNISAITLTGKATIITDAEKALRWSEILISAHPHLEAFVKSPTTSIITVDVFKYFYVKRFQEVIEWNPNQD